MSILGPEKRVYEEISVGNKKKHDTETTEKAQRPRRLKVPGLSVNSKVYCL